MIDPFCEFLFKITVTYWFNVKNLLYQHHILLQETLIFSGICTITRLVGR